MSSYNQQQCWTPNMTGYNQQPKSNTWNSDFKKNGMQHHHNHHDCGHHHHQHHNHVHHHHTSECQPNSPFKKMRNLSNENGKMQRHVSDFQQSHFIDLSQNQISVQSQSKLGKLMEESNENYHNQNSYSASASTNDNSNSDVEIIEDDYAKWINNIPSLHHSKSTFVPHQTTSDYNQQPFQLAKMQSAYSNLNNDNFDDVSSFTGEATRSTQKKRFVNREERFEFNQKIEKMKKTEMCRNIIMYQHCKYGDSCSYAHNMDELVPKQHLPSNYKTKLCSQYQEQGYCMYGQRCQFLHSIYDLSDKSNINYKRGLAEEARLTW